MNRDQLNDALDAVRDEYLSESIPEKKRSRLVWYAAAAALALVLLAAGMLPKAPQPSPVLQTDPPPVPAGPAPQVEISNVLPGAVTLAGRIAAPEYPQMVQAPQGSYSSSEAHAWEQGRQEQYDQPKGYARSLEYFWLRSLPLLLDSEEKNTVCSPINIYCALAMLAECTDGTSRQQILDLLGLDSIEDLRTQAGHVWNAHYCSDGATTSILGSSLWLDDAFAFDPDTVSTLAKDYYASVFHGDLGSSEMNAALQSWLNDQTGGLLKDHVNQIEIPKDTALALATTILYRAGWHTEFLEADTVTDIFHGPNGDLSWAFLHQTIPRGTYYEGSDYGAVALGLDDGSKMWLVLPAEGKTPADILKSGSAVSMILANGAGNSLSAQIHLSLPRFDVSAQTDLLPALEKMGITHILSDLTADFTPILPGRKDIYLGKAEHAARVVIDEEGVTGAAYTIMYVYGTGAFEQPEQVIDFTLDRPFLFIIESKDGLPTFAGVVNQP